MRHFILFLLILVIFSGCEKEFGVLPDDSGYYQKVYGNLTNNVVFDEGAANTGVALEADYATNEIYAIGSVGDPSDSIAQKIYIFKTDKNGYLLAETFMGDSLLNAGVDIKLAEDGVIVCGFSKRGLTQTGGVLVLAKLDKSLGVTWEKSYTLTGGSEYPTAINIDENGNIIMLGNYLSNSSQKFTMFIGTFDPNGELLSVKLYDTDNENHLLGKTVSKIDEQYIWCGTELKATITKMNYFEANSDGDVTAFPVLKEDNSQNEVAVEIQHVTGADFVLVGSINYDPDNEDNKTSDIQLTLLNVQVPSEALRWTQTYGGEGFDEGISVAKAKAGGYIVLGNTESFGEGGTDFYLIKTDAAGNVQWERTYGGDGNERAADVISFLDGYAFIGTATIADRNLITIIRTDLEGNIINETE